VLSIAQPDSEDAASTLGQLPTGESQVMCRGRASSTLVEKFAYSSWDQFGECPFENLRDPGRIHVDPLGHLHICQGISLGSLFQQPIKAICANYDPDTHAYTPEANIRKGIRIISKIPTIIATFHRARAGKTCPEPRSNLSHAANFLYMMFDKEPSATEVQALDAYLVLLADHEFNASTFAARTTAATLSDIHSAVVSAIGALKGDLHGSANRRAMEMFLEIGSLANVEPYVRDKIAQKKKLMGFGHRVYKTEDARAPHLKKMAAQLSELSKEDKWYTISEKVKEVVHREKGLYINVDFYSATVLYYLRIPVDLFTPLFAMSRVGGWTAHILEQYANNRLIRPLSNYTGPLGQKFIPVGQR